MNSFDEQTKNLLSAIQKLPPEIRQLSETLFECGRSLGLEAARKLQQDDVQLVDGNYGITASPPAARVYELSEGLIRPKMNRDPEIDERLYSADEIPVYFHELFTEHNLSMQSRPQFIERGKVMPFVDQDAVTVAGYLSGSSLNYSTGYDTVEEFHEHMGKINTPRPSLLLPTAITENLRINHHVRIADGVFKTATYLTNKIKTWVDIKTVAEEFFEFMGFDETLIQTAVFGPAVSFTCTYFDHLNLPIGTTTINFTKEDDSYTIQVIGAVALQNHQYKPNYSKHLVEDWLSFYGGIAPASIVFRKIFWEYGRPSYRNIKSSRLGDPAFDEFYPWIDCGIEKYISDYLNSQASVLLLIGPPGTGKSTLIRSLRGSGNARMFMCDAEALAREDDPFEKISQLFSSHEYEDAEPGAHPPTKIKFDQNILIIEDADNIINSRKDGNKNMARLLSLTNGLDNSEKVKVVISTNLDNIEKVDTALLRPGRCFDILSFRPLTTDEATAARAAIGKGPRDFGKLKEIPLAVALSDDQTSDAVVVTPRHPI